MLKEMLVRVRERHPLIHSITNYVTANDCANILLACGGSAIMADDPEEVREITGVTDGLNINLGTINTARAEAMLEAGKEANRLGHPVVFDPVGVGASEKRRYYANRLLNEVKFSLIRGNISEIKALALGQGCSGGVDAASADKISEDNIDGMAGFLQEFAKKTDAVVAITGAIDLVADAKAAYAVYNGHPMMSRITGTGCQLSALSAAYITANPETPLQAALAAICAMGVCGEIAQQRMSELDGNASYRNYIIDAVYHLQPDVLETNADYRKLR